MLPIFKAYQGPDRKEKIITALVKIRKAPEEQRAAGYQLLKKPNAGLALKQYALPLFVTQVSDLTIYSLDFQRAVLHIRHHLDLFNQSVPYLQSFFDKTFTKLTDEDHKVVIENLEAGYREMGEQAEIIVGAISNLQATI